MREWVALCERMVPDQDRRAIIDHMVDNLLQGIYWDHDARHPKTGEQMTTDDAYIMAHDLWDHPLTDPDIVDQPEFQEKLRSWFEERYDEVVSRLGAIPLDQGRYSIHREIKVPSDWQPSDGLGIYWTYDRDGSDYETPWGGESEGVVVVLHGMVAPQHVDWRNTILANMDYHNGDTEFEMRVIKGSPIHLLSIIEPYANDTTHTVGETFRA